VDAIIASADETVIEPFKPFHRCAPFNRFAQFNPSRAARVKVVLRTY